MVSSVRRAALASLLCITMAATASAQDAGISGTWSWESPGLSGTDHNSIEFRPDGSFERVNLLANGTSMRARGVYQATPMGASGLQLQTQTQGWLPRTMCFQAPGFPARCNPSPRPPEWNFPVTLEPDSTMHIRSFVLTRNPALSVMAYQVPDILRMAAPAPVQPNIQQPVMPTMHPYTTPNGPGLAIANANHANAQSFINHHMRGCYDGTDGRLYGCQQ